MSGYHEAQDTYYVSYTHFKDTDKMYQQTFIDTYAKATTLNFMTYRLNKVKHSSKGLK